MDRSEYLANQALQFAATSYPDERARLARALAAPKRRPHAAKVEALLNRRRSIVSRFFALFV